MTMHRNEWPWGGGEQDQRHVKTSYSIWWWKWYKTGQVFYNDLTQKFHILSQILSPKLHRATWVVLRAAFCFESILTKARDILKWKVQVTHLLGISLETEVVLSYQLWYTLESFLYSADQIFIPLSESEQGLELMFPITHPKWTFQSALSCAKAVSLHKLCKT